MTQVNPIDVTVDQFVEALEKMRPDLRGKGALATEWDADEMELRRPHGVARRLVHPRGRVTDTHGYSKFKAVAGQDGAATGTRQCSVVRLRVSMTVSQIRRL
jgi:hypothetical protein